MSKKKTDNIKIGSYVHLKNGMIAEVIGIIDDKYRFFSRLVVTINGTRGYVNRDSVKPVDILDRMVQELNKHH